MKSTPLNMVFKLKFQLLACALAGALLTGCASSGYQAGNKTAQDIQSAATQITNVSAQLDSTIKAMNALVDAPQSDLRPQFKDFSSSLASLQAGVQRVASLRSAMAENGKTFFDEWDQQLAVIKNEDIKARSEARKAEVSQKLMDIKRSYAEAETAFKPLMSDLQDVQKYLSVDLTTGGLDAIKEPAAKATADAAKVKTTIASLADSFKALGLAMSSVTPTQAPAQ